MKQKATPIAIVIGILFVALVAYASYHFAFQKQSPPPSPDNAPDYVKARRGNGAAATPGGAANAPTPGYGQGAGYQGNRGAGETAPAGGGPSGPPGGGASPGGG